MAAPRKYSLELRERAVRMYRTSDPKPQIKKLAVDLGVHPEALRGWIRQADSGGIYGSPHAHAVLRREGVHVGRKRVERLMREADIAGISPRRKGFTRRDPKATLAPDLVERDFTAKAPNRLWDTDLTTISTAEGPLWLSAIRDAFSRRVVAWETSARADAVWGVVRLAGTAVSLCRPVRLAWRQGVLQDVPPRRVVATSSRSNLAYAASSWPAGRPGCRPESTMAWAEPWPYLPGRIITSGKPANRPAGRVHACARSRISRRECVLGTALACNDTDTLPRHNVGLHDHNGS